MRCRRSVDYQANKDEKALKAFYDLYSKSIYSLVIRIIGRVQDAEEVTQEVFFKVWKNAEKYDCRRGNVKSWLLTMARRLAIDRIRSKQYKMRERESTPLSSTELNDGFLDFDYKIIETDLGIKAREINEALVELDDQYREVIHLSYFEGL